MKTATAQVLGVTKRTYAGSEGAEILGVSTPSFQKSHKNVRRASYGVRIIATIR